MPTIDNQTYIALGYRDRQEYLHNLADDYNTDIYIVHNLAQLLGPAEDFDGLVAALKDLEGDCDE